MGYPLVNVYRKGWFRSTVCEWESSRQKTGQFSIAMLNYQRVSYDVSQTMPLT